MTERPAVRAGSGTSGALVASPVLAFEKLTYTYPAWTERPLPALREIDLELFPGLTLVDGDSGSGKSTLLRVCNGLVPHFHGGTVKGRAVACGLDVVGTPTRELARRVGFVFQEPETSFVRGTVAREVAFFPENLGLPRAEIRARVESALDRSGIGALASRRLSTLSGGERQRVALAAALAAAPSVLIMDEPMSQLDEDGAAGLTATLRALADAGTTVVVAEHRLTRLSGARRVSLVEGGLVEGGVVEGGLVEGGVRPRPSPGTGTRGGGGRADRATFALTGAGPGGPCAWELAEVTVGFAGKPLVEGADLAGCAGEVVVVTGPNGSGKTTLLRTIAGLAEPLSGRVERRPGRVAYLPQEPGLLLHRHSVRDEIEQTLRWSRVEGSADEVLEVLDLRALAERDPRDLSGGERQRAALAVVLAGRPALALLDEPTRGMDAAARASLAAVLSRLAEQGTAVVAATHDIGLARELGARVVRIDDRTFAADAAVPDRRFDDPETATPGSLAAPAAS